MWTGLVSLLFVDTSFRRAICTLPLKFLLGEAFCYSNGQPNALPDDRIVGNTSKTFG